MKILIAFILSITFSFYFSDKVLAAIFINEFSYQSSSDWVEIYNSDCTEINLDGWKIKDSTESQYKSLSGTILPKSVAVFDITFLNNTTPDKIRLFSPDNLTVPFSEILIPIAGITTSSDIQSVGLELDGLAGWKLFDTNSKNLLNSPISEPCPIPSVTPTPQATGSSTPLSFSEKDLIISEIMADPTEGDEWVEIYNPNEFSIELSNFQLDDIDGGSKPVNLPKTQLESKQYYVHYFSSMFNNGGDSVRILFGSHLIDSYTYSVTTKGISFAKDSSGNWQKTTDPTPGEENSIQAPITPSPTPQTIATPKPSSTPKPTPTPKVKKIPTPKVLSAKISAGTTSASVKKSEMEQNNPKNSYMPFYLATSAITLSFLGHTIYSSNRKKINKSFKKNRIVKKLKSFLKIV